ncbi:ATP-binding protein [Streptomyces rishiriensis]|uniref:ATP-binding protein n=1 Tax=Streptomyces rishiriensis TaxID=68264 RepID=UPI0037CF0281
MTEQAADAAIDTACRMLRLPSIRNEFSEIADQAVKDQMTYRGFLAELLMTECDDRARRRSERRIKAAGFPREKSLRAFDFDANPNIDAATSHTLASCEWIKKSQPLCLIGDSGTGSPTHRLPRHDLPPRKKGWASPRLPLRDVLAVALRPSRTPPGPAELPDRHLHHLPPAPPRRDTHHTKTQTDLTESDQGPSFGSSGSWPRLLTEESIAVPIVAYASARRASARAHWTSSMCGCSGDAGQAWSCRLYAPAMSRRVKFEGGVPMRSGVGFVRSSSGIRLLLPEFHSEESMVRSGAVSVPHSGQGRGTG